MKRRWQQRRRQQQQRQQDERKVEEVTRDRALTSTEKSGPTRPPTTAEIVLVGMGTVVDAAVTASTTATESEVATASASPYADRDAGSVAQPSLPTTGSTTPTKTSMAREDSRKPS